MNSEIKRGDLRAFSQLLGVETWQAAVLLTARGVKVDLDTGEFDVNEMYQVLAAPTPVAGAEDARADVIRYHRERMRDALAKAGLKYVGDAFPRGALLRFTHQADDKQEIGVLCYVAISLNRFGQVSFSVNHLHDERISWVCLVAVPFNKSYLFRREELEPQATKRGKDSVSITIRAGTSDSNLYENRIRELLSGTRYRR